MHKRAQGCLRGHVPLSYPEQAFIAVCAIATGSHSESRRAHVLVVRCALYFGRCATSLVMAERHRFDTITPVIHKRHRRLLPIIPTPYAAFTMCLMLSGWKGRPFRLNTPKRASSALMSRSVMPSAFKAATCRNTSC